MVCAPEAYEHLSYWNQCTLSPASSLSFTCVHTYTSAHAYPQGLTYLSSVKYFTGATRNGYPPVRTQKCHGHRQNGLQDSYKKSQTGGSILTMASVDALVRTEADAMATRKASGHMYRSIAGADHKPVTNLNGLTHGQETAHQRAGNILLYSALTCSCPHR